jgi:tetratricopeptide (TPR) repeat protein
MKQRLLADLRARIDRHVKGDSSGALEDAALAVVAELTALGDLDAGDLALVAAFHVCRYEALGPEQGQDDLQVALALYTHLHAVDPRRVPPAVRDLLGLDSQDAGVELMQEYERTGRLDHLERAISLFRQDVLEHRPEWSIGRYHLGLALLRRFERFGEPADLHEAIELGRGAVAAAALDDPRRVGLFQSGLVFGLLRRFELAGELSDVDEAIELGREVVATTTTTGDPDHVVDRSNLAMALLRRFEWTGQPADLDEAVGFGRLAAADTRHREHAMHLANFANVLVRRFELHGQPGDLDEAVDACRRAITATPADHPGFASYQANLASALHVRYEYGGRLADLDEAIELGHQALDATPVGHPARFRRAGLASAVLQLRFERTGQLADLDEAVDLSRVAVAAVPADHASRSLRSAIAIGPLVRRFERTGQPADLDEAIALGRQAIIALPDGHPSRGALESTVSVALQARFERTGDPSDLDDAIALARAGVAAVPDGHLDRGMVLANLALMLRTGFEHAGRPADLDEAINAARAAVATVPADHPNRAALLDNFGYLLQLRFGRSHRQSDVDEAIAAGRAAAGAVQSPLAARVHAAARRWGGLAAAHRKHDEALAGVAAAVGLLPALAWHGLDRVTREHHLAEWSGLASEAAVFALTARQPQRAVELLEQGRSVLWESLLHVRTDLSRLAEADPETAARLDGIRALLDQHAPTAGRFLMIAPESTDGARPADRAQLAHEWDDTVERVRRIPGFEHFLSPTPFTELGRAADEGPVVIVNVAHARCDALIVRASADGPRVDPVPLPDLTVSSATDRANELIISLDRATRPGARFLDREQARHITHDVLAWLWDAVAAPVLDALGPDTRRLWWCPTGPLTLLPLHAAGHYPRTTSADTTTSAVPEHLISSYTTTLTALLGARRRPTNRAGTLLAIGLPDTPGAPQPLPAVPAELAAVRLRFPPDGVRQLTGPEATHDAVLRGLADHSWTHWSCHGGQNLADPASGAMFLWDRPLTVLDIAAQRLDDAELAYLSACQTAVGGGQLPDEAIHLAAAFQLAGYRHVIATLWSIRDEHAPAMADTVYRTLTATGQPDADAAATALHTAITRLRANHPTDPTIWAAYTHNGP